MESYNFKLKKIDNDTFELLLINIWEKETLTKNIHEIEKLAINKKSKHIVHLLD
jgi:hypothetical protein